MRSLPCRDRRPPGLPSSTLSGAGLCDLSSGSTRRRRRGIGSRSSRPLGSPAGRRWADRWASPAAGARRRRGASTGSSRSGRGGGGSARDLRVGCSPAVRPDEFPSYASGALRPRRRLGPSLSSSAPPPYGRSRAARRGRTWSCRNGPVPPGVRSGPGPDAPSVSGPRTAPSCQPCPGGRAGGGSSVRVAAGGRPPEGPRRGSGCSRTSPREGGRGHRQSCQHLEHVFE
jgi:hypothetical protein